MKNTHLGPEHELLVLVEEGPRLLVRLNLWRPRAHLVSFSVQLRADGRTRGRTNDELLARLRPSLDVWELDPVQDDERAKDGVGVFKPASKEGVSLTNWRLKANRNGAHSAKPKGWGLPVAPRTRLRLRS